MSDTQKIKDRIRKLLNVTAENNATDGEIENAMHAAQMLLHANNLTKEDVLNEDECERRSFEFGVHSTTTKGARLTLWESSLMTFCAEFIGTVKWYYNTDIRRKKNGVAILKRNGDPREVIRLHVYGPAEDAMLAVELYAELHHTIIAMTQLRYGSCLRGAGKNYAEGFAIGLKLRLHNAEKQLTSDSQSTALVVQSREIAEKIKRDADQWLADSQGIHLAKGKKRRYSNKSFNYNAFRDGRTDGQNAEVTKERRKKLEA